MHKKKISSSELADYFAKQAADEDAYAAIYDTLWDEWVSKYKLLSISKGTHFAQMFSSPPKRHWHGP